MIKALLTGLAVAACLLGFTTQVYSNLFQMLEGANSFFIPVESNIWHFEVMKRNPGSGSWWLFARDHKHYYALSKERPEYIYIRRDNNCDAFAPYKRETWCAARTAPLPFVQTEK